MINSITIKNIRLTGPISIDGSSGITVAQKNRNILLDLNDSEITIPKTDQGDISNPGYLTSIQGVSATESGQFYILGDTCTSITDKTQSSELLIFDGCAACSSCDKVVQVAALIQDCSIWLNGLKDCQLYYQPGATALWNQMLSQRHKFPDNCAITRAVTEETRQQAFKQSTKLLYEYKATVAMWNYLVTTKSGNTTIANALQDYGGFVVMSKRTIDLCTPDSTAVSDIILHIDITLVQGQLKSSLGKYNMCVVVLPVSQNSYIQQGTDTGGLKNTVYWKSAEVNEEHTVQDQSLAISSTFTFKPSKACRAVFSGALKILPVIVDFNPESSSESIVPVSGTQIDLSAFANRRKFATEITDKQQVSMNRWLVKTYWKYTVGSLTMDETTSTQTRYYTTGYSKYPKESDSGSTSAT